MLLARRCLFPSQASSFAKSFRPRYVSLHGLRRSSAVSGQLIGTGSLKAQALPGMKYSSDAAGAVVAYVTVPDAATGKKLAHALLEKKVVACVNILPGVKSIYRWKGTVEEDDEQMLIIKTTEAAMDKLTEVVKTNHPYEEPECLALPVIGGSASYLKWLHDNVER